MKELCLLLLSLPYFHLSDAHYFFASPHRATLVNSKAHNHDFHLLKLRGGESDGEKPKRRKRRSKSMIRQTPNSDDVDSGTDTEAIVNDNYPGALDELNRDPNDQSRRDFVSDMFKDDNTNTDEDFDANDTMPKTKKRTRKRRSPASINQDSSVGEDQDDMDLVQGIDLSQRKRKRRKKSSTNRMSVETNSIIVDIPDEADSIELNLANNTSEGDQVAGIDEPPSKQGKRRRKKSSSEVANANGGIDESSDESTLFLDAKQGWTSLKSVNTSDEPGKKKLRRKKRRRESGITTEIKEPAGIHGEEQLVLGNESAGLIDGQKLHMDKHDIVNTCTQSINATIELKDVTDSEVREEGDETEQSMLEIVSIDTTIEMPGEEIVPESVFSNVEVMSDILADAESISDPSEQSEALSISVDLIHDMNVKSMPGVDFAQDIQSQLTTPQDEETTELDLLSPERISIRASIEIPDEEVVPESLFSNVEIGGSLHDAERIKDVENGGLETSFIIDSKEEPQIELPEPMHENSNEAREELEKEANIIGGGTSDTDDDANTNSAEVEQHQFDNTNNSAEVEQHQHQVIVDTKDQQYDTISVEHCATSEREAGNVARDTTPNKDYELSAHATDIPGGGIKEQTAAISETDEDTSEFDKESLVLSVVTWNLGEVAPSEKEASFIRRFQKGSDLVMIGAQECEEIKPRRTEGHRSRHLRKLGIQMLGNQYVPLAIHSLGGIQMALYCRRERLNDVEFIGLADVTCGVGNVFHNKGAIGVYLKLNRRNSSSDTTRSSKLLLVTGHLAAHVKNVEARNDDFKRIITELESLAPARFLRPRKNRDGSPIHSDGSYLLNSMDHVIFSGDLNYRIDLPREYVDRCIGDIKHARLEESNGVTSSKQIDIFMNKLLRRDQLLRTISSGRAFANFSEAKIAFLPTFKFDKGSSEYDTSYKQRIPAWTDRIVFKSNSIRVIEYDSVPNAMHSDHRPVFGTYELGWGTSDIRKKNKKNNGR